VDGQRLLDLIKVHEGLKLTAYQDSEGVWTIGYGRNLQKLVIDKPLAETWLIEDIATAYRTAQSFPQYQYLDTDARQDAFIEMVYNIGRGRLQGFTEMLKAIPTQNWLEVARQALDSKWHTQVKKRAEVIAEMFRSGEFPA
jgi:lysozyme